MVFDRMQAAHREQDGRIRGSGHPAAFRLVRHRNTQALHDYFLGLNFG